MSSVFRRQRRTSAIYVGVFILAANTDSAVSPFPPHLTLASFILASQPTPRYNTRSASRTSTPVSTPTTDSFVFVTDTTPDTLPSGVPAHAVPALTAPTPVTVTATAAPAHTPTTLPPVFSSAPASDTEDSDDDLVMLAVTSAPSGRATAIAVNDRSAPQLTAGIHTLETVTDYIHLCRNFFVNKQVAPEDRVRRVAHQIADPMFANWVNANADTVYSMTFNSFSAEIYNRLLGRRWAAKQADTVRRLQQGAGTFDAFKNAVLSSNALLISSPYTLSEDELKAALRTGLCAALRVEVNHAELDPAMGFDNWLDELERLDQQRLAKAETLDPLITQLVNQRLRDLGLSANAAHKSSSRVPPPFRQAARRFLCPCDCCCCGGFSPSPDAPTHR
ncbi:hypothetical protein K488DRAFT_92199 [Vararia minispora EC-137]|uniref:Uncharacterized protein n=1 Tax=Vararia minispora EC-137 TaxID=1314806 RepID=A0ACB8Q4G8_9AGAM|nr:hypothetical protein K488DRAFT_92199 [Vararia minispora EC-137]